MGALGSAPQPPRRSSWVRRNARWLWAAAFLCLAPTSVVLGSVAALAVGWVALRAIGRHRAVDAGQRTPRWVGRETAHRAANEGRIQLGRDARGRAVSLEAEQLGAHGLILGASGSGKSTTLLSISGQQIARGQGMVAVDLKGSADFAAQLAAAAAAAGRPFRVWTPDGGAQWNPLAHGNATELKDKLISTERFSEPHYKRAAERYVQLALGVMAEAHPEQTPSLARLVRVLDPARLQKMAGRLGPERRVDVQEYLRGMTRDQLSAVRGLESRLAVITESHTGAYLEPGPDAIDLRRALDGEEVVLFSLNASTYGQLASQIGTLVVQDLVSATGARERAAAMAASAAGTGPPRPRPATVMLDEFSALGADHVLGLIARGRSAGVSVLLATQELADLDRVSRGFRQQVLGSTAVKIAHRQDVSESAHEVARLSGTEPVWEQSYSQPDGLIARLSTGSGGFGVRAQRRVHERVVDRPRVDPSVVQSLGTGEAVVITKVPRSETRLTRIGLPGIGRPSAAEHGRAR